MKVVAISDLHGNMPDFLPTGDILTISGDVAPCTGPQDAESQEWWVKNRLFLYFDSLLKNKQFTDIVFIGGNHDRWAEELYFDRLKEEKFISELPEHVHYLRDSEVTINGIKFYGTPWSTIFYNWSFMASEKELLEKFKKIPKELDVLLTHGPMHGYNDCIAHKHKREHLGSKSLYEVVADVHPKYIFCGHIHSGNHTIERLIFDFNYPEEFTQSVNVSLLDEDYDVFYTNVFSVDI